MKHTHSDDVMTWSRFDAVRSIDFNSWALVRPEGLVLVDPLPLEEGDAAELAELGEVCAIVITNSDHVRHSAELRAETGAEILAPVAERDAFEIDVDRWLCTADTIVPGLTAVELRGSKTPGELALVLDETTLITGDLVRGQRGGRLNLLPDPKLRDRAAAIASVRGLLRFTAIEAVLVGDGWPVFVDGHKRLSELVERSSL